MLSEKLAPEESLITFLFPHFFLCTSAQWGASARRKLIAFPFSHFRFTHLCQEEEPAPEESLIAFLFPHFVLCTYAQLGASTRRNFDCLSIPALCFFPPMPGGGASHKCYRVEIYYCISLQIQIIVLASPAHNGGGSKHMCSVRRKFDCLFLHFFLCY